MKAKVYKTELLPSVIVLHLTYSLGFFWHLDCTHMLIVVHYTILNSTNSLARKFKYFFHVHFSEYRQGMSQTEDKLLFASDIGHIFFATSLQPITCKGADNLSIFFSTRTTTTFFKLTQPSATVFIHGETILHTYSRTNHSHWKVLFMRVFPTLEGNHRWTKKKTICQMRSDPDE